MRFLNLLKNEFRFAVKYGILLLYIIVTTFYVVMLSVIPESAKHTTGAILIFTDPAAMGLFFMGAVMLLEKSQRVNHAISVTPVKTSEYIIAKSFSMLVVGTAAGIVIGIFAKANIVGVILAVVLSSFLFSLCAIIVSVKTESLNSFMLGTIPFEMLLCLPAILYQFRVLKSDLWIIHPGVSAIVLLSDKNNLWFFSIISLCLWNVIAFVFSHKAVTGYMQHLGGGKI